MPSPCVHLFLGGHILHTASLNRTGARNFALTIKRKSDVAGIFPNDAAIVRLVGALMLEQQDEWAVARQYMALESLVTVSDNPLISLPGMAA